MKEHENSLEHKSATSTRLERTQTGGRIDAALVPQAEEEIQYWKNVLKRVVATVKSLPSQRPPFRGTGEHFGSVHSGNYIMSLELIAEFDPFLVTHIRQYRSKGSGSTSYLSSATCSEFISLMLDKIRSEILAEVKLSKYYSISVDSTPNIAHVDQLAFIIRYFPRAGTACGKI
jgi:hypothetical protein